MLTTAELEKIALGLFVVLLLVMLGRGWQESAAKSQQPCQVPADMPASLAAGYCNH